MAGEKKKLCRLGFKHLTILLVIRLLCFHSDNGPLLTLRNKLCYFAVSPSQISFLVFLLSVLSLSQTLFHTAFPHSLPGIGLRRCPTPPPSHTRGTVGDCVTFLKFYPSASILDVLCVTHILRRCETKVETLHFVQSVGPSTAWLEKSWLLSRLSFEITVCFRETSPN